MNTDVLTNSFLRGSKMFSFNTENKSCMQNSRKGQSMFLLVRLLTKLVHEDLEKKVELHIVFISEIN